MSNNHNNDEFIGTIDENDLDDDQKKLITAKFEKLEKMLMDEENNCELKENSKAEKSQLIEFLSQELEKIKSEEIPDEPEPEDNSEITNTLSIYPITNYVKNINKDSKSRMLLDAFEKKFKIKFSEIPKFKLLKQIGFAFDGLDQMLLISDMTFNQYQEEMSKLNHILESSGEDIEANITNLTTINIFLRDSNYDFKESEKTSRQISVENLDAIRFSYVEFDEKFLITKKYTVGELKMKACTSYNVETEDFIFVLKNFEMILYSVDLYHQIFLKNVQKGYIENTSRFFQMNPHVTDQFALFLVRKKVIKSLLLNNHSVLKIYNDSSSDESSQLRSKIEEGLEDILYDDRRADAIKRIDPDALLTIEDLLKHKINNLIHVFYDYNLNKRKDAFLITVVEDNPELRALYYKNINTKFQNNCNNEEDLDNSVNLNNNPANNKQTRKRKHARKFTKIPTNIELQAFTSPENQYPEDNYDKNSQGKYEKTKHNSPYKKHQEDYKVKPELAMRLMHDPQYKDVLIEFDGKAQFFVNKCEDFLKASNNPFDMNIVKIQNEIESYDGKLRNFNEDSQSNYNKIVNNNNNNENCNYANPQECLDGLINYLFEHVKNKGTIFSDEKFNESLHKRNNSMIIENVIETYMSKENEYLDTIRDKYVDKNKKKKIMELEENEEPKKEEVNLMKKLWSPEYWFNSSESVFILVLIYISFAYFNTNPFTIAKMSFFNQKVKQTFDEKALCNDMFLKMTSPSELNTWFLECYITTFKNYLMSYEELEDSPIYSIFIYYSDIQIVYKDKISCSSSADANQNKTTTEKKNSPTTFNITFIKNKQPQCYNTAKITDIYERKKWLFDNAEISVETTATQNFDNLFILDTLAFPATRLDNANVIRIHNRTHLYQFEKIFAAKKILSKVSNDNKYLDEIDNMIRNASISTGSESTKNTTTNPSDSDQMFTLIDSSVTDVLISSYYMNQDLDKVGVFFHKFSSPLDGVKTDLSIYSLEVDPLDHRENIDLDSLYFVIIIILIIFAYLKYAATEDFNDSINKNLFLLTTVIIFGLENIFKFYHMLKGTNNLFFTPMLVYDIESRDRYFFYMENIKVFKGITVVTICFHFIYVLFSQKDLMILKKLFKRVIIVFFIVLFFLIFTITIFTHLVFGSTMSEFSGIMTPLYSLFTFVLGVETGQQLTEDSETSRLWISIMLYFIRLAVINFTLIIMILVYQRFQEKEELQKELEAKRKARGK